MAYTPANLSIGLQLIGGKIRVWTYLSTDPFSTVDDTDYFTNVSATHGLREGDIVFVQDTDSDPPDVTMAYVSAISAAGNGTLVAMAFTGAATFTNLTVTGNSRLGDAAADLVGFHNSTGISQRAGSVQATTNLASSTDFGVTQLAAVHEIMNTLIANGLWKGSA